LRDVKDNAVGTLSQQVTTQLHSIKGLKQRLTDIENYLGKVVSGIIAS
jgi:26S proteasome regulatory subunit N8